MRPLGITLRADNGRYVRAHGDGTITADTEIGGVEETFEIDRPVGVLPRLVIRDRYYFGEETGARIHLAECSDFSLFKDWLDGKSIDAVLAQRAAIGFNLLRVWLLNTSVIPGGLEPEEPSGFTTRSRRSWRSANRSAFMSN